MKLYTQPRPPDMLPNGLPSVAYRRSRIYEPPEPRTTEPVVRKRRRFHIGKRTIGFLFVCLIVTGLVIAWQQIAVPWWTSTQDQWNYGSSRVTQLDADVGHDGLEHFVAEYDAGAIVVIEIPFAHPGNAHVYTLTGMVTDSSTLPVILLSTEKDSRTGRIDLMVTVKGTSFQTVLYNTGSSFSSTGA